MAWPIPESEPVMRAILSASLVISRMSKRVGRYGCKATERNGTGRSNKGYIVMLFLSLSHGEDDARETNPEAGSESQARGQSANDPGQRIRQGGDRQNPSRRARCSIAGTGHRYWPLEGSTRRRCSASAKEGQGQSEHPKERRVRVRGWPTQENAPPTAASLASCDGCSEARTEKHGVAQGSVSPWGARRGPPSGFGALGCSTKGSPDEGCCYSLRGRQEGCTNEG